MGCNAASHVQLLQAKDITTSLRSGRRLITSLIRPKRTSHANFVGLAVYWGYIGIMENKMETTGILGLYRDYVGLIQGL